MIKRFKQNKEGRDFFTTDLHGCYDLLHEALKANAFDISKDRLFVGGDWCDRGPDSGHVLDYIYEPWIHSIQANHEAMLIHTYQNKMTGTAARMLYQNGGQWYFECSTEKQKAIYQAFKELPLAIEIESPLGLIGIIHAEVPYGDWEKFRNISDIELDYNGEAVAQWARTKYDKQDKSEVKGLYKCYVGHTPTNSGEVEQLGNVFYSDLGSFFRDKISFIQIN